MLIFNKVIAKRLKKFFSHRRGATAIEYGLIAAGIALVIITAVNLVGNNLGNVFNEVANDLGGSGCVVLKTGPSC